MLLDILPVFLISMPGGGEIIIIAIIVILLFGAKKIPELARGLGKGIKEFKDAKDGDGTDEENDNKSANKQKELK